MNIDTILRILVPKDHSFLPLFDKAAENLIGAARLLKELMSATGSEAFEAIYIKIKDVEHKGDDITKATYHQLNKSFITPFEREDIHELISHIDDVVDSINGIARRMHLYKPKNILPEFSLMADILLEASHEISNAIRGLHDPIINIESIRKSCNRLKELESHADDIFFTATSGLFENEEDPIELMKNNKIMEMLERSINDSEDVAETIKSVLIKLA